MNARGDAAGSFKRAQRTLKAPDVCGEKHARNMESVQAQIAVVGVRFAACGARGRSEAVTLTYPRGRAEPGGAWWPRHCPRAAAEPRGGLRFSPYQSIHAEWSRSAAARGRCGKPRKQALSVKGPRLQGGSPGEGSAAQR